MRIFIAVEISDAVKDELKSVQDKLNALCPKGKYTARNNFHLTLRYIGEVDTQTYYSIKRAIDECVNAVYPFTLSLDKVGSFQKKSRHILWAGLKGEMDSLFSLYTKLEACLSEIGLSKEDRSYKPHITLGRHIHMQHSIDEINKLIQLNPLELSVKSLSIMESINLKGQLIYRPLYRGEFIID